MDKTQAQEIIALLRTGEVPEWHGIPCTLPKGAIERILPIAQEMKAKGEINQKELEAIEDVLGVPKPQ